MPFDAILDVVKTGGVPAIFALLWWLERQERITTQTKNETLSRESLTTTIKVENTMQTLVNILSSAGKGSA